MPFEKIDVGQIIKENRNHDLKFKKAWDSSRLEYSLLSQLISLRKKRGLSQTDIAKRIGSKQQTVSRIEKREGSLTLKTFCNYADALGCDIQLAPRNKAQTEADK